LSRFINERKNTFLGYLKRDMKQDIFHQLSSIRERAELPSSIYWCSSVLVYLATYSGKLVTRRFRNALREHNNGFYTSFHNHLLRRFHSRADRIYHHNSCNT